MVLRTVIQELQPPPEGADLYRLNGDQFLVLCRVCNHVKMRELFECLQEYVRHPRSLDGISYQFSISGGVAMFADSGPDWAGLLAQRGTCHASGQEERQEPTGKSSARPCCQAPCTSKN